MTDSVALPAIVITEAREEIGSDILEGPNSPAHRNWEKTGFSARRSVASLIKNHQIPVKYMYKCRKYSISEQLMVNTHRTI